MIGVAIMAIAAAQEPPPDPPATHSANVEVRVWQSTRNAERLYISARPEGGSWRTLGTIPLDMSGLNSRETFRYGDIVVGVDLPGIVPPPQPVTDTDTPSGEPAPPPDPVPEPEPFTVNVEVRVWQSTADSQSLYISARQEGGDWGSLGTIPLDMSGLSGTYRYGDVAIAVEVSVPWEDGASEPEQEEESDPWVDPRPDDTYSLQYLAELPAPSAPQSPPPPDHIVAIVSSSSDTFLVHLVEATGVVMKLIHNHESREYPVICTVYGAWNDQLECEYSEQGPLNSDGTERLRLYYNIASVTEYEFVSLTFDGSGLTCIERPVTTYRWADARRTWWCYDTSTYAAWERARDAALEPATDPLERYLRQEAGPPLWWQGTPYAGEGPTTTGVFEPAPYVTYTISWIDMPPDAHNRFLDGLLVCVPYTDKDGTKHIVKDVIATAPIWLLSPSDYGKEFYVQEDALCEFAIVSEYEWGFSLSEGE